MTEDNIYRTLKDIIVKTFNIKKNQITPQTSSDDIEEWDSLGHIRLLLNIEAVFNIKFNTVDIPKLISISKIIDEIKKRDGQPT